MPFQSNPNAGAPDTQMLNFLFNREDQRRHEEREDAKMQMAMAAQQAKEQRLAEAHALKQATTQVDLLTKLHPLLQDLGTQEAAAKQTMGKVKEQAPLSSHAEERLPTGELPPGIFPLAPQDEQNAQVQANAESQLFDPINAQYAGIRQVYDQLVPPEVTNTLEAQGRSAERTRGFLRQEKTQEEIDKEQRAAATARDVATTAYGREKELTRERARIAAHADAASVMDFDLTTRQLARDAEKETDPVKKADMLSQVRALNMEHDSKLLRFSPDEAVRNREKTFSNMTMYRRKWLVKNLLDTIDQNPQVLGFEPNAIQALRHITGTASEMLGFVTPMIQTALDDPSIGSDAKSRLESIFINHRDPNTGQQLSESRLLEASIKWTLVMGVNESGRVTQKQLDEYARLTNFSDMFTPIPIARDTIRAVRRTIARDLQFVDRPDLEQRGVKFLPDGRIEGDPEFISGWASDPGQVDNIYGNDGDAGTIAVDPVTKTEIKKAAPSKNDSPAQQLLRQMRAPQTPQQSPYGPQVP